MESYRGFVKLVRRDSQQVTLAYQDATSTAESTVYLLSPEDFGVIMPLNQVLLNFEVGRTDFDLTSEVLQMRSWHQISPQVLAAVAPAFKERTPPTPDEWRRIMARHSLQLCPIFSCKSCGTVRYVPPIAYDDLTFPLACSQVGLRCNSIRQDFAITEMQKSAPVVQQPAAILQHTAEQETLQKANTEALQTPFQRRRSHLLCYQLAPQHSLPPQHP